MSDDILNRYICVGCGKQILDFSHPTRNCHLCCANQWRLLNTANTAATTAGVFGTQYDSISSIDDDVQAYTEQDQLEKDWKQIDEARRQ